MNCVKKIALLSDENTTQTGKEFLEYAKGFLEKRDMTVWSLALRLDLDIADAVYQFDRISLEIKPDLLIVADFACIRMQSPEEEPFYNNMTIPVIHLLFRRPWEYDVFMIWRCNFTTRCYCLVPEDVWHIRTFYRRVPKVKRFLAGLWTAEEKMVCYEGQYLPEELYPAYDSLPDYMKTIAKRWMAIMERNELLTDEEGLKQCLQEIGFVCSEEEYLDILYMMRGVFPLYYKEHHQKTSDGVFQIEESVMQQQLDEFIDLDFEISLL